MAKQTFKMVKIESPTNDAEWNITAEEYNKNKKIWDSRGKATRYDKKIEVAEVPAETSK